MNIKVGTYLKFENKIVKVNKKDDDIVKLRCFSYGKTKEGYSYQSVIKLKTLLRYIRLGKAEFISPEKIMQILLKELIK